MILGLILLAVFLNTVNCDEQTFDVVNSYHGLCINGQVRLNRVSDFLKLADYVKRVPRDANCATVVNDAILMLEQVVKNHNRSNYCSLDYVKQIEDYHSEFISPSSVIVLSIPEALKKFFVAYTIEINKSCRVQSIKKIIEASENLLVEEDFKIVEEYIGKESSNLFMKFIDSIMDRILEMNLASTTGNRATLDTELVYMVSPDGERVKRIQSLCRRRFRSIYEQLVLPPVSLTNLGYTYPGIFSHKNLSPEEESYVKRWNRIVYICESLRDIVIVDNPDDTSGKIVTLTKLEAEEMVKKYGKKAAETDGRVEIKYKFEDKIYLYDELTIDGNVDKIVRDSILKAFKENGIEVKKEPNLLNKLFQVKRSERIVDSSNKGEDDDSLNIHEYVF